MDTSHLGLDVDEALTGEFAGKTVARVLEDEFSRVSRMEFTDGSAIEIRLEEEVPGTWRLRQVWSHY